MSLRSLALVLFQRALNAAPDEHPDVIIGDLLIRSQHELLSNLEEKLGLQLNFEDAPVGQLDEAYFHVPTLWLDEPVFHFGFFAVARRAEASSPFNREINRE